MKKIILASNSPRRRELLKGLDLDFSVEVLKDVPEDYPDNIAAEDIPLYIAREKLPLTKYPKKQS